MKSDYFHRFGGIATCMLFLLLCLPSCVKDTRKQMQQLRPLRSSLDYEVTQNNVTLRVKKLSKRATIKVFGSRGRLLFNKQRRAFYPIQLSIQNKSNESLMLKSENIDLTLTDYNRISKRLQKNTALNTIGALTAGTIITAAVATGGIAALFLGLIMASAPLMITGITACVATPFFLVIGTPIITTVKGIETAKTNKATQKNVKEKTLADILYIEPGQTIDTIIFVTKRNCRPEFNVTFVNQQDPETVNAFKVTLMEAD